MSISLQRPDKPRWQFRFDNYKRAYILLSEAIYSMDTHTLSQLEQEGVIQRFEYTWELAWKLLKDYLEDMGTVLPTVTPTAVIKTAFAAKLITDGEVWLHALDARNKMAHTYNFDTFEEVIAQIQASYLAIFEALYDKMLTEIVQNPPRG
jgi:nucleotidyltransferase substrate binding protein (TIGR01987 family)